MKVVISTVSTVVTIGNDGGILDSEILTSNDSMDVATLEDKAEALKSLFGGCVAVKVNDSSTCGSTTPAAEAFAAEAVTDTTIPGLTDDMVLAALRSDQRYKLRTIGAVYKALSAYEPCDVLARLNALIGKRKVYTKSRRADRGTLYGAK